jgi:hypothetical protein
MKKIINLTLLGALFALSISPSLAANNETLAKVREDSLTKAMELLKGKNASVDEVLKTAKQIEDYILAGDGSKNKESIELQGSPNDYEKKQQIQYKPVSSEKSINFNGLSLGINGQLKSTSAKVKSKISNYEQLSDATFNGVGQQNFIGDVYADYKFKINDNFGLLLGASIDLNDVDLLKINAPYRRTSNRQFLVTEKNHYSLYLAPSYQFSEDTMGYFKIAYHHSDVYQTNNLGVKDDKKEIQGYGLGAGIRSHIYDNLYANIEIQRVMFSNDSIISSNLGTGSTIGSFGLGYNFASDKKQESHNMNTRQKFNGFSIGLRGLLKSSSIKGSAIADNESSIFDSVGQQNLGAGVFTDYIFNVNDNLSFMIGGSYDFTNTDVLKISATSEEVKIVEKNRYSLYLAPAYQLSNSTLGFIKIAYARTELEGINNLSYIAHANKIYTQDFNGPALGFGIRTNLFDKLDATFEVERAFYNKEKISPLTLDMKSTTGSLGLSYRF